MKKTVCSKCGIKRGRRQCASKGGKYICGDCCSSAQLNSGCPRECVNYGKISDKVLWNRINELAKNKNPEAIVALMENHRSSIDGLVKKNGRWDDRRLNYLYGWYFFFKKDLDKAIVFMEKVSRDASSERLQVNMARLVLGRAYLEKKDIKRALDNANNMDDDCGDDKRHLLESIYLAGGRMYELLDMLNSMENKGLYEKYMLLQCALVLKKNGGKRIIAMIDDLLDSGYFSGNRYETARLLGLKIKLLFKNLRMKEAYEVFSNNQDIILKAAKDIYDCREACSLSAFFMYTIDKERAMEIYNEISGVQVSSHIMEELYDAFSTMDVSPYIRARAIEKSVSQVLNGREFNRTVCAADILYEDGEYSLAMDLYIRALDEGCIEALTMYRAAVCFIKGSRFKEAYEILTKILLVTRLIPGVYPYLIRCCLELDIEWSDYFKSMEIEKLGFNELFELAGSLMMKGHYEKAGYLYSTIFEKYKGMDVYSMRMTCHCMADVYRNLKNYKKGVEIISMVPRQFMDGDLYIDLGCIYYDWGQLDMAKEAFDKGIEYYGSTVALFNMAILYMSRRDFKKALSYLEDCLKKIITPSVGMERIGQRCSPPLVKILKNIAICCHMLGKDEDALIYADMAGKSGMDDSLPEITSMIQQALLGTNNVNDDIAQLMDGCMVVREDFIQRIRMLLNDVIDRYYGKTEEPVPSSQLTKKITAFIMNMRAEYSADRNAIEHSDETFQRFVNSLTSSFEKSFFEIDEVACTDESVSSGSVVTYAKNLAMLGDSMFNELEYAGCRELIYASLIPYFKSIKVLCHHMLYPYYVRNMRELPAPEPEEYRKIGVYIYKTGSKKCLRVDSSLDISCDEYLFEINCHPGIRNRYLNHNIHYMPWNKLKWIISGIKRGWDVLDDVRSSGLLLLFYGGYKNYLGIDGEFKDGRDIIKLSGELIHMGNERDFCIKSLMSGCFEPDYVSHAVYVRDLALKCMDDMLKIKCIS